MPLAIDLCCGKGGWTRALLDVGFRVVGFDLHHYPEYPGEFVRQDVRSISGAQLRGAALIVASPPCQEFTTRYLPWGRGGKYGPPVLGLELFRACERIGSESGAPYVIENVRGAVRFVGPPVTHLGPFYLWGPGVPALFPIEARALQKGFVHKAVRGHLKELRPCPRSKRREWSATVAMVPDLIARTVAEAHFPRGREP